MNGKEHYDLAEQLIAEAESQIRSGDVHGVAGVLQAAQVHATLAVADAESEQVVAARSTGNHPASIRSIYRPYGEPSATQSEG